MGRSTHVGCVHGKEEVFVCEFCVIFFVKESDMNAHIGAVHGRF